MLYKQKAGADSVPYKNGYAILPRQNWFLYIRHPPEFSGLYPRGHGHWTQYITKRYAMDFHLSTEHDFGGERAVAMGKRACTAVFFRNLVNRLDANPPFFSL